jgi:cell division protein FtsB
LLLPQVQPEGPLGLREKLVQSVYAERRKFATAAAAALVCVLAYHVVFGANGFSAYEAKRHENAQLAVQVEQLKQENDKLEQHNARLQSDKGVIEESIRTQLHFAKPDEVIVTVPEMPAPANDSK